VQQFPGRNIDRRYSIWHSRAMQLSANRNYKECIANTKNQIVKSMRVTMIMGCVFVQSITCSVWQMLCRCHTSAHQAELLRQGEKCFLITGDVYRRDSVDRTHYPVFHQMEGFRVFSPEEIEASGESGAFSLALGADYRPHHIPCSPCH
jgi:hypothetical protein